jgi:hypothetical protein
MASRTHQDGLRYQESGQRAAPTRLLVGGLTPHTSGIAQYATHMPRTELLMSVLSGTSGGLAGLVWSRLVSAGWMARRAITHERAEAGSILQEVAAGVLFAAAGAALGFLYWLGWGLISLVGAPWYATGAIFGVLAWTGVAGPMAGVLALRSRASRRTAAILAVEWLVTCLAAGLACALAWRRYA